MAGLASALLALILVLPFATARAGDLYTGFQMDSRAQYFTYLGLREDLPWESSGLKAHVQVFAAAQRYEYESGNVDIKTETQFLIPSFGLTQSLDDGAWRVSAVVGPKLEWKRENGFPGDNKSEYDTGVFAQAETMYYQESHSFHAIVSYASLDDFFFGRIRGKLCSDASESGSCTIFVGMDVAGMGNDDFRAIQVGPLVEVPFGRFSMLARAGYQHDNNFGSGGYGGVEIYLGF